MVAEARFVAAADLHLGRPIASLPDVLRADARTLGPFGALQSLVELALRERADAVLIGGDLVDDDGAYFEVYSAIQEAVKALDGIPMIAVAGNHDAKVLPRLADSIDGLLLLGSGGRWGTHTLSTDAGDIEILGWSFPDAHCRTSPFETPPPPRGGRRIGVLHGDLDTAGSSYAPFTSQDLKRHAADAWLLGHVHVPSHETLSSRAPAGYLGSACGLDPSESGSRGAWLVRCHAQGFELQHRAIAPIHWATATLDASEIDAEHLDVSLQKIANAQSSDAGEARAVGVRVRLAGQHPDWADLNDRARGLPTGEPWSHDGRRVFIDRVVGRVTAPLDLATLAQEPSVAGRIAGMILELEGGGATKLVDDAARAFSELELARPFRMPALGERTYPTPEPRSHLIREARAVLDELVAQQHEARH